MSPAFGCATPSELRGGGAFAKSAGGSTVVRLPERKIPAYTREPSPVTASARGASPNSVRVAAGSPCGAVPSTAASNTHTSARPTPEVVSAGCTGLFCPRCAVVTKARPRPGPAAGRGPGSDSATGGAGAEGCVGGDVEESPPPPPEPPPAPRATPALIWPATVASRSPRTTRGAYPRARRAKSTETRRARWCTVAARRTPGLLDSLGNIRL